MLCNKCGAEIIGDQPFCTSCGARAAKGSTYELYLPDSTTNKRAYNLTMELTRKNLEQVTALLSRPHALILNGLSLNKAAELKSKYMRLGVTADLRRSPEFANIPSNNGTVADAQPVEDSVFKTEDKPVKQIGTSDSNIKKKWVVADDTPVSDQTDGGFTDLLKLIFLVLTIIAVILIIVFAMLYYKKNNEIQQVVPEKSSLVNKTVSEPQEIPEEQKFGQKFDEGLITPATPAQNKALQSKGNEYRQPSVIEERATAAKINSLLKNNQINDRKQLNEELEKIESEDLHGDLLNSIKKVKKGIDKLKSSLEQDRVSPDGDIELIGTRFAGTLNLPDQTKIEVTIHQPNSQVVKEEQIVNNYSFTSQPIDSIVPGNYRVMVKLSDLESQVSELQQKLAGVLKAMESKQNSNLIDKVITTKKLVHITQMLPSPELQAEITKMMSKYFDSVTSKNQVLIDEENIVIKGKATDARQFIVQAAAGIGFASSQSNWQIKNLVIIVNNRKYKIPVKACREAMISVNNDYKNNLFAENIVKNLM